VSYIVLGHFCPTDDTLPSDVAGSLESEGYPLQIFGPFHTEKAAQEFAMANYWMPDGQVFELEPPKDLETEAPEDAHV
jgi:hypothetical protein